MRLVLVCGSDTGVRFGYGSGAWVRFGNTGSGEEVRFVGTASGDWLRFAGTGSGARVRFEGAGIGTRLEFGSTVGRPAEPVIRAKVLPISGDGTEVGLLGTLAVSKVLVGCRVSRVRLVVGLSEVLSVGVEGPDPEVIFRVGVVPGPSAGPPMLSIWMEGRVVSTILGLGTVLELQVLTIGVHNVRSSCCFMGDVIPIGRATSEPGEGRG